MRENKTKSYNNWETYKIWDKKNHKIEVRVKISQTCKDTDSC